MRDTPSAGYRPDRRLPHCVSDPLALCGCFPHMRRGSRAGSAFANPVRSGRKQPQRTRTGSFPAPTAPPGGKQCKAQRTYSCKRGQRGGRRFGDRTRL